MIREDLVAERVAVQTYADMIRWLGEDDPTTRRVIEPIRTVEIRSSKPVLAVPRRSPPSPRRA